MTGARVVLVALLAGGIGWGAVAGAAEAPAGDVALLEQARERARTTWSWKDRKQTLTLTIIDGRGNERVRKLAMFTRREPGGGEKSLAVFLEPADVRGTAFLQHTGLAGASGQWLHLPELGRTRQITSKARRKSFMGTDFSYADLDVLENALRWSADDVKARRLTTKPGDGPAGRAWFSLQQQSEDRPYDHVTLELSEPDVWMRSMKMFDGPEGPPAKLLQFEDIREVGGIPTALRLVMSQPDDDTHTKVEISGLEYDSGIGEGLFTKRALERGLDHVD